MRISDWSSDVCSSDLLASTATINVSFGQANVVGGSLNDLIEVGGDLTLGGTLNVETAVGGSFDPGIYRVINYGGTLTDNGLAIGTLPDRKSTRLNSSH